MKRQNEFDVEMRLRKLDSIRDNLDMMRFVAQAQKRAGEALTPPVESESSTVDKSGSTVINRT